MQTNTQTHTTRTLTRLLALASLCALATGCAALNEVLAELDGGSGSGDAAQAAFPADTPEGARAYTPAEEAVAEDGWVMLDGAKIRAEGVCEAVATSSPFAEYWEVTGCRGGAGGLGRLDGSAKGQLDTYIDTCLSGVDACSFVGPAIRGQGDAAYRKLFQGLLLTHDAEVLDALGKKDLWWAGAFFSDRGFLYHDGIVGLGIFGEPADRKYLEALVDTEYKRGELGRDLRNKVARSFWWLGDAASAEAMVGLLEPEHAKRYKDREFRPIILTALLEWGSEAAVPFCEENMRDLGGQDRAACMMYLAGLGKTSKVKDMVRYVEESGDEAVLALALTRTPEARAYFEKTVDPYDTRTRIAALALSGAKGGMALVTKQVKEGTWDNYESLAALSWFAGTPEAAKAAKLVALVGSQEKKRGDESGYALAVAVRAQLGDRAAVSELLSLLDSPSEDVRSTVVDNVGGSFGRVMAPVRPTEIVAERALMEAIVDAMERESDEDERADMARAALNIRARLRTAR